MKSDPQEMKMAELKELMLGYSKADDGKAWRALALSLVFQLIAVMLIHLNYGILGWTLNVLNAVRLFVQFHDMAHFSFFSSIQLNKFIGTILGIYVHFPFQSWRDGHNHHHKHFGNLDRKDLSQTILFTKQEYQNAPLWKQIFMRITREPIIFFFVTVPYAWFIGSLFLNMKRYGVFSSVTFEKILSMVIFTFVCPMIGIPAWKIWFSTYCVLIIGTTLFHLQHSVNTPYRVRKQTWNFNYAAVSGSTFLQVPFFLQPFTNGIQFHHIHHLSTHVPSYFIKQCHETCNLTSKQESLWDFFQINKVDYWLAIKSMANVMFDEEKSQLNPFSYRL